MRQMYAEARESADLGGLMVAWAAVLTAGLVGVGLATEIPLGLALLFAAIYLPLVFVNFPLAVCLWIPLVFLEAIPALNLAAKATGLLLILGWVGALASGLASRSVIVRHRRLFEALALLIVWLTLSLAWAPNTGQAATAAWQWWAIGIVFAIVATSITSERLLVLAIATYVAGAVLASLVSSFAGGLTAAQDGRQSGGVGDPNFLAAALVSAIPLAFALSSVRRTPGWRALWLGAVVILTIGVVASQSRGGMAAAVGMWVAALVVLPRRRQVLALGVAALAAAALAFSLNPGSWERASSPDPGGTGRVDLWTVAWNMFADHPIQGVGVRNFGRVAPSYVREVGPLDDVDLVVKTPDREVHNSYLEFLAENGVIGLVLFLLVAAGCLRAGLRAARSFADSARPELVALAHGLFAGTVGLLVSYFFISGSVDRRLWILLALAPASLEIAHRLVDEHGSRVNVLALPDPPAPVVP